MTKAELAEKLHKSIGITRKEGVEDIEMILGLIKETLESGEQVKISGFGIFEVKQKNARQGRNPQTGEKMTLAARRVITFKPSSVLREAINKAEQ